MKPDVYNYLNYREYIRDHYEYLKKNDGMTLRDFARKAGFNTHTFLSNVIENKRSLTVDSSGKVARAFALRPEQRTYLELLVRFNNSGTADEKNDIYEQMRAAVPRSEIRRLGAEYFEIFRKAYVLTIREIVALPDFKRDAKWIAKKIHPRITPGQVEKALQILQENGLIEQDSSGKLHQAHADLTTGAEVKSLAIALYHKQLLELAAHALDETPAKNRDISALTLNIAKSDFDFIKRRTAEFRRELLDFLKKKREDAPGEFPDEQKRALYYLNMQFFNATEIPW
jgi:uncharacterized protein (TIGR02147 family)